MPMIIVVPIFYGHAEPLEAIKSISMSEKKEETDGIDIFDWPKKQDNQAAQEKRVIRLPEKEETQKPVEETYPTEEKRFQIGLSSTAIVPQILSGGEKRAFFP
ncbi:hypothetical protein KsCSTR_24470 [Candidatus Kuenenia stuttgartiensis]|jgi:hypothetical protein|uniref:Uncharacterized protein n=2 Tax=Candidatus Brocadiaceae TaxID=1127830 RepID=A0A6G7GQK1_KUEST|nr:hypothetical protein KsCSTR_24470 [Candidatus Kuenenia stuttgartiensis]